jgi:uncharacterized damage-inducible protein DinB
MSLGQLVLHVACLPANLTRLTQLDEFDTSQASFDPPAPTDIHEVHAALHESIRSAGDYLKGTTEQAAQSWRLTSKGREVFRKPRIAVVRSIMLNHWYHHRGQLSVHLRLPEVLVIYGRADENPFA